VRTVLTHLWYTARYSVQHDRRASATLAPCGARNTARQIERVTSAVRPDTTYTALYSPPAEVQECVSALHDEHERSGVAERRARRLSAHAVLHATDRPAQGTWEGS
jgi:hypothetical protein